MKKLKVFFICALLIPCFVYGQRWISRISYGSNDSPDGWPWESRHVYDSTNTPPRWSTNWTWKNLQDRVGMLQQEMDATNAIRSLVVETNRAYKIQLLQDLFNDFDTYETGWNAGTNYTAAQMQVILRKHNGALLLLKPMLKELYDSRQ